MRLKLVALLFPLSVSISPAHGFVDPTGPAQVMYLTKILLENYKRYRQLRDMMDRAKNADRFFKNIHSGLEGIEGLLRSLPVRDEGILGDISSFNKSVRVVADIYGAIPNTPESGLHTLHDKTVAESFRMINSFKKFSERQESNSNAIQVQSEAASPKGAAKATAVSNALLLKSVNQLIRLQSQSLKMQSEQLAMKNRNSKSSAQSYQNVDKNIGNAFKNFHRKNDFIKF